MLPRPPERRRSRAASVTLLALLLIAPAARAQSVGDSAQPVDRRAQLVGEGEGAEGSGPAGEAGPGPEAGSAASRAEEAGEAEAGEAEAGEAEAREAEASEAEAREAEEATEAEGSGGAQASEAEASEAEARESEGSGGAVEADGVALGEPGPRAGAGAELAEAEAAQVDRGDAEPEGSEVLARAEPPADLAGSTPRTGVGERLGAWLEVGVGAGGDDAEQVVTLSPEIGMRFVVAEDVVADVSWALTAAFLDVRGEGMLGGTPTPYEAEMVRLEPGNPILAAAYSGAPSENLRLEVGLAVAVPAAARAQLGSDADGLAERAGSEVAHRAAMSMRGYWSPWRFAPERFALALPARLAVDLAPLSLEGELGLGVMLPVLGDRGPDPDVVIQLAVGAALRPLDALSFGLRVRGVGGALGVTVPGAIVSLEPWARLHLAPLELGLRASLSLNGDDGLAGSRGPAFGVFVDAGVRI